MSSNNPLALVLDFGTQSCRASLVNKEGEIVALIKKPYDPPYKNVGKGLCEQSPDFYWDCISEALTKLDEGYHNLFKDIVGCTLATFRDTAVFLDKDLKPVRDSIMWFDERTAQASEKISPVHRAIFALVGMKDTIDLNRKRTMAHWVKENEPENWAKTYKYVNISTYLYYKLTGELQDSVGSFTGHYPFDFKKRDWYKDHALKGDIFGVRRDQCCKLVQQGENMGPILDEVAKKYHLPKGIPVYASGSDKACETVGLAALSPQIAAISYGTASTIELSSKKYVEPVTFLPDYPAALPGYYNSDIQIYRGYWMLKWFISEFGDKEVTDAEVANMTTEEYLNKKIEEIAPGSDGLILQPYWGPELDRPLAKGSVIGFTSRHTKYHLYRAIIEGIGYALREGMEGIEKKMHKKAKLIRISGGGSQSDAICQITADIFGLPVERVQTYETTTLGAGMCVLIATGVYKNYEEAATHMVRPQKAFQPNEENHKEYDFLYKNVYLKLYPSLKNVYKDLTRHENKKK